jgi:NADPH-dependent 2,4-dienoyl-CoA reductase/sulfur reductase-like enzyme
MHVLAIGGSDGGISAALRARELDPSADVTVMLADAYPNFPICGVPYYLSGDVADWRSLAHRSVTDLEGLGIELLTETLAQRIHVDLRKVTATGPEGQDRTVRYDALIVATGAVPIRPPIAGLDTLGTAHGVHLLHTMGDVFAVMDVLEHRQVIRAVIVGAGYIGLEMAEALTTRGISVTQLEQLPQLLPTLDPELGVFVAAELAAHGVDVATSTRVSSIEQEHGQLVVRAVHTNTNEDFYRLADLVLVIAGVAPDTALAASAGAPLTRRGAIKSGSDGEVAHRQGEEHRYLLAVGCVSSEGDTDDSRDTDDDDDCAEHSEVGGAEVHLSGNNGYERDQRRSCGFACCGLTAISRPGLGSNS